MQRGDYQDYPQIPPGDHSRPVYPQYAPQSADPLEEVLGIFPCVKLRGLPFEATVGDILIFFNGVNVLDIIFFVKDGKTTGEAVVLFSNLAHYELALQRNHQHMGRRYIEVFQAKRFDYYTAEQMFSPAMASSHHPSSGYGQPFRTQPQRQPLPTEHTGVIRMRGLPFNCTVEDIAHFFRVYNVRKECIKIGYRFDGRPTGEAYVTFETPELASQALSLDRSEIGSRYIELFISTPEQAARA